MKSRNRGVSIVRRLGAALSLMLALLVVSQVRISSQFVMRARDPGVRGGPAGAGGALPDLTPGQTEYFNAGLDDFAEEDSVAEGLGPRMSVKIQTVLKRR